MMDTNVETILFIHRKYKGDWMNDDIFGISFVMLSFVVFYKSVSNSTHTLLQNDNSHQ